MLFAMFLPTWRPKTLIFIYMVFSIFLQSPQDNPIYKNTVNNVSARQKLQKSQKSASQPLQIAKKHMSQDKKMFPKTAKTRGFFTSFLPIPGKNRRFFPKSATPQVNLIPQLTTPSGSVTPLAPLVRADLSGS